MTLDEAIEHGRAWVAAGWVWARGQAVIFVLDDGGVVDWLSKSDMDRVREGWQPWTEIVPDLRDRGTLGHALGQVRDAWGMPLDTEEFYTNTGSRQFEVALADDDYTRSFRGGSLGSALLAARRAAP